MTSSLMARSADAAAFGDRSAIANGTERQRKQIGNMAGGEMRKRRSDKCIVVRQQTRHVAF
jgi:hypothetical protein